MAENWYLFDNDITYMFIKSKKYGIKTFLIDTSDYNTISQYKWHIDFNPIYGDSCYASTKIGEGRKGTKNLRLHKLLMGNKEGYLIDHINRNKCDNRRCNLRFVTYSENNSNKEIRRTNNKTTGIKGYTKYFDKRRGKIAYMIKLAGFYDGRFYNETKALKYLEECKEGKHKKEAKNA